MGLACASRQRPLVTPVDGRSYRGAIAIVVDKLSKFTRFVINSGCSGHGTVEIRTNVEPLGGKT
jgi:hypothetical protein